VLAYFPALVADLVQRGTDAIVIQDLLSFRPTMLEAKLALKVCGIAEMPRECQSMRHGEAGFFAVLNHPAVRCFTLEQSA
jgi:hypothetical protein